MPGTTVVRDNRAKRDPLSICYWGEVALILGLKALIHAFKDNSLQKQTLRLVRPGVQCDYLMNAILGRVCAGSDAQAVRTRINPP
jgi:hypothetical protein